MDKETAREVLALAAPGKLRGLRRALGLPEEGDLGEAEMERLLEAVARALEEDPAGKKLRGYGALEALR